MRLSPKPIFFALVALGLPFAVTIGWVLGSPVPGPPLVSGPGGAGGIGAAPARATTPASGPVVTTRATRPVAVESSLAGRVAVSTAPSGAASATAGTGSPSPTSPLLPPVPTPTGIFTTPPSLSATAPSESAEPDTSGLGAAWLVRGS